jgi:hypothetical protein
MFGGQEAAPRQHGDRSGGRVGEDTFGAGSLDGEEGLATERHRKHNESRKDQCRRQMSEWLSIPQQREERADHDDAGQRQAQESGLLPKQESRAGKLECPAK